jgi:hypothetical protein
MLTRVGVLENCFDECRGSGGVEQGGAPCGCLRFPPSLWEKKATH